MKNVVLNLPAVGFIVGTRVALGFGIGLLVADKLGETRRRSVGAALVAIGALTTIPAAAFLTRTIRGSRRNRPASMVDRDERADRFDHEVWRFVVGGDLKADDRPRSGLCRRRRHERGRAERIDHLERGGQDQGHRRQFEQQEDGSDERRQDEWAQRLSVPLIQAAAKQEGLT